MKTKTWEDEVSVDVKPFVDYFRNIQRNPEEYLDVRFITRLTAPFFFTELEMKQLVYCLGFAKPD